MQHLESSKKWFGVGPRFHLQSQDIIRVGGGQRVSTQKVTPLQNACLCRWCAQRRPAGWALAPWGRAAYSYLVSILRAINWV